MEKGADFAVDSKSDIFDGLNMLEFDGIIFAEHKVDQHSHDLPIISEQPLCLVNTQVLGTRHSCHEVCVASESVEFLRQDIFNVTQVSEPLECVIKPFPMNEYSGPRHPICLNHAPLPPAKHGRASYPGDGSPGSVE